MLFKFFLHRGLSNSVGFFLPNVFAKFIPSRFLVGYYISILMPNSC